MSEMPAAFAVVATPKQKLWVLYFESSRPTLFNVVERRVLNWALVKGKPLSETNSEHGVLPLIARYGSKALTGHTTESVFPRHNLAPFRKGSVFDYLMVSQIMVGEVLLFNATSFSDRCTEESYSSRLGEVISPTHRKPKNAVQQAIHNMTPRNSEVDLNKTV